MSTLLRLLGAESGLSIGDLEKIIATAPDRYKRFRIPKRSGGFREIAQPARELKLLQRILMERILGSLPIHPSATAYRKRVGLIQNALPHASALPIVKLDFSDFFPSLLATDWLAYCERNDVFPDLEDRQRSALLFFHRRKGEVRLRLSIGAPSSPMLSNLLLFDFDSKVQNAADERGIRYTRYADDMTFSGQRLGYLNDMPEIVAEICRGLVSPRLELNQRKTTKVTTAARRTVTGIVLANDGTVGLGRDRKRAISAKVHHATQGKLSKIELRSLAGELAFAKAVEPEFIRWLGKKYGESRIRDLKRLLISRAE